MEKLVKRIVFTVVTLSFVGLYCCPSSWAVTDDEFQALEKQVQQQNQQIQALEQEHSQDQSEIQSLKDQQGQTDQKTEEKYVPLHTLLQP